MAFIRTRCLLEGGVYFTFPKCGVNWRAAFKIGNTVIKWKCLSVFS